MPITLRNFFVFSLVSTTVYYEKLNRLFSDFQCAPFAIIETGTRQHAARG